MTDDPTPALEGGSPDDPTDAAGPGRPDPRPTGGVGDLVRIGLRSSLRPGLRATQQLLGGAASVTNRLTGVLMGEEDPAAAGAAIRGEVVDRTRQSLALEAEEEDDPEPSVTEVTGGTGRLTAARLRRRGRALLARSADLDVDVEVHPALETVLDQLAPDEARILRTLAEHGPQPVVHVEVRGRLGTRTGRRTLARNQGRLGPDAGCRYPERVEVYLDNLERLGLVRPATEEAADDDAYEILSVQPSVVQALRDAREQGGRGRVVRASVGLTALGGDFVEVCFGG